MSRTAIDTSVLVAALQSWHSDHARAQAAVARCLDGGAVVPHHVVLETFSVLTRMPGSLRLSPRDALSVLERTLKGKAEVVTPDGPGVFSLLAGMRDADVSGGAVYDAAIAHAAFDAGSRSMLTLNRADFARVAPAGLEIIEP